MSVSDLKEEENVRTLLWLLLPGAAAVMLAAFLLTVLPAWTVQTYVGALILLLGASVLARQFVRPDPWTRLWRFFDPPEAFSRARVAVVGALAGLNKGLTGGGYGTVVTAGQILAGISVKKAVPVSIIAEALLSLIGASTIFVLTGFGSVNVWLLVALIAGGLAALPVSGRILKHIEPRAIKIVFGLVSVLIGTYLLIGLWS